MRQAAHNNYNARVEMYLTRSCALAAVVRVRPALAGEGRYFVRVPPGVPMSAQCVSRAAHKATYRQCVGLPCGAPGIAGTNAHRFGLADKEEISVEEFVAQEGEAVI